MLKRKLHLLFRLVVVTSLLFFGACGKNEAVRTVGQSGPIGQAPIPNGGGYQIPPTTGGGPYFNPQLPPQMPVQYTPWLPVQQYFYQQPQTINIWVNIWSGWQTYANYYGINQYNFNQFWFDYCPTYYPQYNNVWNYFDQNFYWWMNYDTQIYCTDPSSFWQYYGGFNYNSVNSYCGGYCF